YCLFLLSLAAQKKIVARYFKPSNWRYVCGGIVFQTGNGEGGMIAMNVDSGAMRYWEAMELESNGWFVPSISQLETMYFSIGQGADNIGNFADGPYWSSIEGYVLNFANGNSSSGWNPVLNFRVRLISYF
ncbi:hypothetical protein OAT55_04550, partial [Flavobacteriaceae bacterium]|nr:hypothetical protein [Flavobacteriaceae bacterium]